MRCGTQNSYTSAMEEKKQKVWAVASILHKVREGAGQCITNDFGEMVVLKEYRT